MNLYYHPLSPPCWSVLMLARQMNLQLNLKQIDSTIAAAEREAFVKLNPQHQIPTLAEGDFVVGESRTILSYLVDAHGKPAGQQLIPKDPKARAVVQFRLDFDLGMLYRRSYDYFSPMWRTKTAWEDLSQDDCQKVHDALSFLETYLGRSRYAAGDHLTIADYALMATVTFLVVCDFQGLDKYQKVMAWHGICAKELVGYDEVLGSKLDEFRKMIELRQKS